MGLFGVRRLALGLCLVVAGCGSSEKPADLPALARYESGEAAKVDLEAMLGKLGADRDQMTALLAAFDDMLAEPALKDAVLREGIAATCAATGGAGGVLVRVHQGHGLASFPEGRKAVPVDVSGWTAGASLGAERSYVVGIAVGLVKESDLVGDYEVTVHGGSAGKGGARSGTGRTKKGTHELHWVGTAVGFGADAGAGTVTLSWEDTK